jgi:hypothetical protein
LTGLGAPAAKDEFRLAATGAVSDPHTSTKSVERRRLRTLDDRSWEKRPAQDATPDRGISPRGLQRKVISDQVSLTFPFGRRGDEAIPRGSEGRLMLLPGSRGQLAAAVDPR